MNVSSFQTANFEFFQRLVQVCCNRVESHDFPVFRSSINDAHAHRSAIVVAKSSSSDVSSPLLQRKASLHEQREMSLALSLGELRHCDVIDVNRSKCFNWCL